MHLFRMSSEPVLKISLIIFLELACLLLPLITFFSDLTLAERIFYYITSEGLFIALKYRFLSIIFELTIKMTSKAIGNLFFDQFS